MRHLRRQKVRRGAHQVKREYFDDGHYGCARGGRDSGSVRSPRRLQKRLAPQVGFEPTTRRLTVACSTVELLRNENAVHSLPCPTA
jgi:hypothetical protein